MLALYLADIDAISISLLEINLIWIPAKSVTVVEVDLVDLIGILQVDEAVEWLIWVRWVVITVSADLDAVLGSHFFKFF